MAFLLPKISPPPLLQRTKRSSQNALPKIHCSFSSSSSSPSPLTKLELPPLRDSAHDKQGQAEDMPLSAQDKEKKRKDDFYLNVGIAVRTLREDIPALFYKDLNYDIYMKVVSNLACYGNTSVASIALVFDESVRSGRVNSGDIIDTAGFRYGF